MSGTRARLGRRPAPRPYGYLSGTRVAPTTDTGWATYQDGARLFLPAGTNYCTNPSFETNTGTLATGWADASNTASAPTFSKVAALAGSQGLWAQRIQHVSAADSAKSVSIQMATTAVGSFAAGDIATVACLIAGSAQDIRLRVFWRDAADAALTNQASGILAITSSVPVRVSLTTTAAPANTSRLYVHVTTYGTTDAGETLDITIDDMSIVKSSTLEPYFDGSYDDCAWTDAPNASTSTRTASDLDLTDYVQITSAGVVAAGAKVAYARNPSSTYYGSVVVTDDAKSGAWQTAFAAAGANYSTIWASLVSGDMLVPLRENGLGWVKH